MIKVCKDMHNDMKLVTKAAKFVGKHDRYLERDYIFVEGDEVEIINVED